jgi:hypothetical protein
MVFCRLGRDRVLIAFWDKLTSRSLITSTPASKRLFLKIGVVCRSSYSAGILVAGISALLVRVGVSASGSKIKRKCQSDQVQVPDRHGASAS